VLLDQPLDVSDLVASKPTIISKPDRVQPKLGDVDISSNMDMWWLLTVARVKEATVGADSQDGRPGFTSRPLYFVLVHHLARYSRLTGNIEDYLPDPRALFHVLYGRRRIL
jgi:hypothetical protein